MSTEFFKDTDKIFNISNSIEFENMALEVFKFQYNNNKVYNQYCNFINKSPKNVKQLLDIPFLPISFFKTHKINCQQTYDVVFSSSGTTGMITSKHYVYDNELYKKSFIKGFEKVYGSIEDYIILGLLPSYLEREGSSLIYMVDELIKLTKNPLSDFFLNDYKALVDLIKNYSGSKKIMIIGVTYALLELLEQYAPDLSNCIVMETGGMKGKRKEIPKKELHDILKKGFGLKQIHSEYGMTELLSQAYSVKDQIFEFPGWMKVLIRDANDPLSISKNTRSGGINIIDLANVYSCSFIATQDLGRLKNNGLQIIGRFDNSDVRGCNLLVQ